MRKAERACIYVGLAAALMLGLGWRGPGLPAIAGEAMIHQPGSTLRVATVDMLKIVEKMVKSDRYAPAREANNKDLTAKLEAMAGDLQALQTQIQSSPQNAPETQAMIQNFQARRQEFDQARNEAANRSDEFNARQIAEAYRLVVEVVDAQAKKAGYTHVLATRSGPPNLKSGNIAGTVQEMLARPVVVGEPANDITKAVMDELKLPDTDDEPAPITPAAPGSGATPGPAPAIPGATPPATQPK